MGWAWLSVFAAAAACRAVVFECSSDAQCTEGVCAAGYCAFDDPQCASGQRYGSHGPQELAGKCVPPSMDDTTSVSSSGDTVAEGSTSSSSGAQTSSPATSTATGTSTTVGVDDSGGGSTSSGPGSSTDGSSSDDGPVPGPPCTSEWEDDFAGAMLDPIWEQWLDGDAGTVEQVNGVALFTLPVTSFGWVSIYTPTFGIFEGYSIVAEVASPPSDDNAMVWLEVTGTTKYELVIHDGMLQARLGDPSSPEVIHEIVFDPLAHRFLRVGASQGNVTWAASADGQTWVQVHEVVGDALDADHYVGFGLGTELWTQSETEASLEHIYRCPYP